MNADPLAHWYRWIEYAAFGKALERSRFTFLHHLQASQRILILGEGDGRTLQQVLNIAPNAHIEVVESSSAMASLAQSRITNSYATHRVKFTIGDARSMNWQPESYDAIVTHYFLDCFSTSDAQSLVTRLSEALRPNGVWLIAEFSLPHRGWRRWHAYFWLAAMYRFFRWTTGIQTQTLPPVDQLLGDIHLNLIARRELRADLISTSVWRKDCRSDESN